MRSILRKSHPLDMNDERASASALYVKTVEWADLWIGRSLYRTGIVEKLRKWNQKGKTSICGHDLKFPEVSSFFLFTSDPDIKNTSNVQWSVTSHWLNEISLRSLKMFQKPCTHEEELNARGVPLFFQLCYSLCSHLKHNSFSCCSV